MQLIKKLFRLIGVLFFAILFSVCMVAGVVPVLPKRKEQVDVEVKIEPEKKKEFCSAKLAKYDAGSKKADDINVKLAVHH
jgi:hypothetical protein